VLPGRPSRILPPVLTLLLYLGGLLLALIAINVLLMRTMRAEKEREREGRHRERGTRNGEPGTRNSERGT
jgi:hypothetical protein